MTKKQSTSTHAATPERRGRKSLSGAGESARLSVRVSPRQLAAWHAMPDAAQVLRAWLDRKPRAMEAKTPKAPKTSRAQLPLELPA